MINHIGRGKNSGALLKSAGFDSPLRRGDWIHGSEQEVDKKHGVSPSKGQQKKDYDPLVLPRFSIHQPKGPKALVSYRLGIAQCDDVLALQL